MPITRKYISIIRTLAMLCTVISGLFATPAFAAVNFNTTSGSVMIEAENATRNAALYTTQSDANASGTTVKPVVSQSTTPSSSISGLEFNIIPDRDSKYDIWIRYSANNTSNDSLYFAFNGSSYSSVTLPVTGGTSTYLWAKLHSTSNKLTPGTSYNVKIHPQEMGMRIDQLVVTSYPFFNPTGIVTASTFDSMAYNFSLTNVYPTPTITPPSAHPRLYFRSSHISKLKADMTKAQNSASHSTYNSYVNQTITGILPPPSGSSNYDSNLAARIQAHAFKYAMDNDTAKGNSAINAIKNYLNTIVFDDTKSNREREMGHIILLASQVYDWCYPLLSSADRNYIIAACEGIASRMPIGWPSTGQGAITGHGSEGQLLRDLLSFGIATYNERPDIYNIVAGRLFAEYVEPRNYWYPSHSHYQGTMYGPSRHKYEIISQYIMYRMSGTFVFAPDMEYVPYEWLYARRPDGNEFRTGESSTNYIAGEYLDSNYESTFYSSNLYGNPYVKQMYKGSNTNYTPSRLSLGLLTPMQERVG